MRVRVVFVVLSIAFGIAVFGAAITTKKFIETHQAESRPAASRPAV
jgi:hypothetical protein